MMGTMVYRVQDAEGRGPWRPGFSHKWVEYREDCESLKPWPDEFGLGILRHRLIGCAVGCGCMSIEQLRRWFTESEYRALLSFGYQAVEMEAGRILAESSIQCVFERLKPLRDGFSAIELYPHQGDD